MNLVILRDLGSHVSYLRDLRSTRPSYLRDLRSTRPSYLRD